MGNALDCLLRRHASEVATRRVILAPSVCSQLPLLIRDLLGAEKEILVVADTNTWPVAGRAVAEALAEAGLPVRSLILEPEGHELKIHPDEHRVEQVESGLREGGGVAVAVGAGTLNDIAKMASFHLGRPYAIVATAPSMNGWTSAIAAIVEGGLKKTVPARGPVLVAADPEVLRNAPERMIGAGFADLMAKGVASADWRLADRLLASGFDPRLEEISKTAIDLLDGQEEAIAERRPHAIERLMEGLCISGLSMAVAQSSSHISGAEHLFSHYIDMMLPEIAERELHGRQVGIGTLCAAAIYGQLLEWSPDSFDLDGRVASQPSWQTRRLEIERHFGELAAVVLPQAEPMHAERDALRERLERLAAVWPELREELAAAIASRNTIERRLRAARAPVHYADLGLRKETVREILRWAREIRSRYTVLHLAADLGLLDAWVDHAVETFDR